MDDLREVCRRIRWRQTGCELIIAQACHVLIVTETGDARASVSVFRYFKEAYPGQRFTVYILGFTLLFGAVYKLSLIHI
jgi:hypothetical protein